MPGTAPRGPLPQRYEYRLLNCVPCSPAPLGASANSTMPARIDPPRLTATWMQRDYPHVPALREPQGSAVPRPGTFKGWAAATRLRQQDDQCRASLRLRSFWYFGLPVMSFVTAADSPPSRTFIPSTLALIRFVCASFAPYRSASSKFTWMSVAPVRSDHDRSAPLRSASLNVALTRRAGRLCRVEIQGPEGPRDLDADHTRES